MGKNIIATVSMFEPLSGGKGKFTSATAIFDQTETIGSVLEWAGEHAGQYQREVVKVEVGCDKRDERAPL